MTVAGVRHDTQSDVTSRPAVVVSAQTGFRPDIDGLRAVAIILVVAYHAGLPHFGSGFIGVDVFFVISGYLIMTQLDKELQATGRVRLATFWARRARRLVPAAAVTTIAVVIVSQFVYSPFHWQPVATEALATTFYVSNELFRRASTDYFAPALTSSPLLNTWSLAVEEQFYLLWPSLLVLTAKLASNGKHVGPGSAREHARRTRIVVVGTVMALSFLFSQQLLASNPQSAYFASLSRAWEFGVGAMLALLVASFRSWTPRRTRTIGVIGIALLVWAIATITEQTAYPGWAALLPVLATAAAIVAGAGHDLLPARTLGWRPLQAIGRVSYSWYLWHWPVMILGIRALGRDDVPTKTELVLFSLVPAYLTYRFLESRLRRAPALVASNRRTAAVMLSFVAVVSIAAGLLWIRGESAMSDPYMQRLAAARNDAPALPPACATNDVTVLQTSCVRGDPSGSSTVLLIGDSHAAEWLPALDEVGKTQGLRIIASVQGVCPGVGDGYAGETPECATKIAGTDQLITDLRPSLVVMSNSVWYRGTLIDKSGDLLAPDDQAAGWQRGVEERARRVASYGGRFLLFQDTPSNTSDPNECLGRTRDMAGCQSTRAYQESVQGPIRKAQADGLAAAGSGTLFDPLPYLCGEDVCPLERDGRLVYTDQHHLTDATARSLAGPVGEAISHALGTSAATTPP